MANRQQPAPAGTRARSGDTARVVVLHKNALPGWFWGMLGCLTVLGVGFGALLFAAKNGMLGGGAAVAPVAPATAAALPAAVPAPGTAGGPQIEQLAPPAAQPLVPVVDTKLRAPAHPMKLARSPSVGHAVAAAPAATKADAPAADDTAAEKKPADKPAPPDDGRVHIHHATASDSDDDDDDDGK